MNKRVLIIPLNWGMGHATRCVPIIELLIEAKAHIYISGSGISGQYLKQRFNQLPYLSELPDYDITYPKSGVSLLAMMKQWPKMEKAIVEENHWLKEQQEKYQFDFILSDHRFGIYHISALNILIAHQLNPILPFGFGGLFRFLQKRKLLPFQEIWIPDIQGAKNLSGILSRFKGSQAIHFIGWQSRFNNAVSIPFESYDWVGWVSGPENLRTEFEQFLQIKFERSGKRCLLICGQPDQRFDKSVNGVRRVSHLEDGQMKTVIQNAEKCFARSGYSTLMDLKILQVNAELYPTPGQTEQIYLANRWKSLFS